MNYGQAGFHTLKFCYFDTILSINLTDFLEIGSISVGRIFERHNEEVEKERRSIIGGPEATRGSSDSPHREWTSDPTSLSALQFSKPLSLSSLMERKRIAFSLATNHYLLVRIALLDDHYE